MARRFSRRRKPRVVWLPNVGSTENPADTAGATPSYILFETPIALGIGNNPTIETPLVVDNPQGLAAGTIAAWDAAPLASIETFGYRLRRIVGNLIISVAPAPDGSGGVLPVPNFVIATAGLIIRRVDDTGAAVATGLESSANSVANIQDPWIWRRSWLLSPALKTIVAGTEVLIPVPGSADKVNHVQLFSNNTIYHTGPNCTGSVDQKTARNVAAEERLFLDVSLRSGDANDVLNTTVSTLLFFDYRVLASLRTGTGNRRNAVR